MTADRPALEESNACFMPELTDISSERFAHEEKDGSSRTCEGRHPILSSENTLRKHEGFAKLDEATQVKLRNSFAVSVNTTEASGTAYPGWAEVLQQAEAYRK